MTVRLGVLVALLLGVASQGVAQPAPLQVVYQGRLVDLNGTPLESPGARLTFKIYSQASPTSAAFVWGEVHTGVPVRRGVFTVRLGAGTSSITFANVETAGPHPLDGVFDGSPRFLEVRVETDAPLAPLTELGAVPLALSASNALLAGQAVAVVDPAAPSGPGLNLAALDGRFVLTSGGNVAPIAAIASALADPNNPTGPGITLTNLVDPGVAGGRLTASSTDAVTTTDSTSSTLYYLPSSGTKVALFTGATWLYRDIGSTGVSASVTGLTTTTTPVYDVFLFSNAGSVAMTFVKWASDTTRATALAKRDGVRVSSADNTRRYVGTIYVVNSGGIKVTDASQARYIWNMNNRVLREDFTHDSGTWTVAASLVSGNPTYYSHYTGVNSDSSAYKHGLVVGVGEDKVQASIGFLVTGSYSIAFALDPGSVSPPFPGHQPAADCRPGSVGGTGSTGSGSASAEFDGSVGEGHHSLIGIERAVSGSATVQSVNVFASNANFGGFPNHFLGFDFTTEVSGGMYVRSMR